MSERLEKEDGGYFSEKESAILMNLISELKGIYTITIITAVYSFIAAVTKGLSFFGVEWLQYIVAGIAIVLLVVFIIKAIPVIKAYKEARPIIKASKEEMKKNKKK